MRVCSFQCVLTSVAKPYMPACNSMDVSLLKPKCFVPCKTLKTTAFLRKMKAVIFSCFNWLKSLKENLIIWWQVDMYQINCNLLTWVNNFPSFSFADVSGEWVELLGSWWMVSAVIPVPSSECRDDRSTSGLGLDFTLSRSLTICGWREIAETFPQSSLGPRGSCVHVTGTKWTLRSRMNNPQTFFYWGYTLCKKKVSKENSSQVWDETGGVEACPSSSLAHFCSLPFSLPDRVIEVRQ